MKLLKKIETMLSICLLVLTAALAVSLFLDNGKDTDEPAWESEEHSQAAKEKDDALPARYDARTERGSITVKNQGALGTCWAVAASSALEAYFLPQERLIFSADHVSLQNSFSFGQNDGGDYTMVMAYLAGWQGPVLEVDDTYGDGVSPDYLAPVKHVQEMQLFQEKDYDAMKRAILQNGAVQSAIYMDLKNAFSASVYYNQLHYSYFYDGIEPANHDILIIGWDDFYDASRFNRRTSSNGAFLCQNSWGEQFGGGGVFWVSYEDVNIGKNAIAYTKIEDADNYDHIDQTDLCGWVGQLGYGDGTCYFANVFTAESAQSLEAVGFYVTGKGAEYKVYLVEQFEDKSSLLPKTPVQSGRKEEIGYYTVALPEAVPLEAGQRYAVIVELNCTDNDYPVATEYAADDATKTVEISDGEGYISHNGLVWTRTETVHGANVCMKTYTKNR